MATPSYDAFAVAAPGLAHLVAAELAELGVESTEVDAAGVAFRADARALYRANLNLRIATRVIVRAAAFRAAHFSDLEKQARRVPWERWLAPGTALAVRVTSRKSRLYHTDAITSRLLDAAIASVPGIRGTAVKGDDEAAGELLLVVRLDRDQCTISVDSSGDLLHRRGYRVEVGKAPLRETLAAAILRGAGWTGQAPLLDPFCGSGTIPIEAALVARRMAPGLHRNFAFTRWPEFDAATWQGERAAAAARALPASPVAIRGSDRDDGAVQAARANAERAGVAGDAEFERRAVSEVESMGTDPGYLVTNPPYGGRVGEVRALRDLYARLGQVARTRFPAWSVAVFAADAALVRHIGLPFQHRLETSNGGIRVGLWVAEPGAAPP